MGTNPLSDITLIIPTFERQNIIIRSLEFWNNYDINICVMDGSATAISEEVLGKFNCRIKYFHMPNSFEERIQFGVGLVTTDYTALIGDDEYFIPNGLIACKNELDSDQNLVACIGTCLEFYYSDGNIDLRPRYVNWIENCNVNQDSPKDRLEYYARNAMSAIFYSLIRTDVWKKAASVIAVNPDGVTFLTEIFQELVVCFAGKTKVIEDLYWLRSVENPTQWEQLPTISIEKWLHDNHYKYQRDKYFDQFAIVFEISETARPDLRLAIYASLQILVSRSSVLIGTRGCLRPFALVLTKIYYIFPYKWLNSVVIRKLIQATKRRILFKSKIDIRGLEKGLGVTIPLHLHLLGTHTLCMPKLPEHIICQDGDFEGFIQSLLDYYIK